MSDGRLARWAAPYPLRFLPVSLAALKAAPGTRCRACDLCVAGAGEDAPGDQHVATGAIGESVRRLGLTLGVRPESVLRCECRRGVFQ